MKLKKIFFYLIIFLFIIFLLSRGKAAPAEELKYGVTFSKGQAERLGLDWQETYIKIIEELQVKRIRLSAYWDEIESQEGNFNWQYLDWQIDKARLNKTGIILAVGGRLPRWPECHYPAWALAKPENDRQIATLNYIQEVINRYKGKENIIAWQIENEPFLPKFGDCPKFDKVFLDKEIEFVKRLDSRPIVLTDSGELSLWYPAASRADIFGTSLYRDTFSTYLNKYIHYPIGPGFFRFKKRIVGWLARPKEWIIIELQAEPWAPKPFQEISAEERNRTMNPEKFKETVEFARQTGFKEFYLWGVEYWYWEKTVNGQPAIWDEARKLFGK